VQLGKTLSVLFGLLSILFVSFIILSQIFQANKGSKLIIFYAFLPLFHAIVGFIGGIIVAILYNLCVKWVGGIKITLEDEEIIQS